MVVMPAMMPEQDARRPTGLCAVVLAAGEGARLRPLSRLRPKPLCPIGGEAMIDHALRRAAAVTGAVAVNVHHGREAIEAHLAGRAHVSVEEPEALGTAGALGHLRGWIDGRDVLLLNGDCWAPGDLAPYAAAWDHERVQVLVAGDDRLRPPERPTNLVAGAFMPWAEVARLAPVPSGLWEASWRHRQAEGRLAVARWDGPCLDCGTPARYLAANMAASGGEPVVGDGAVVEGKLERAVVWPGARVRAGEVLVDAVRADDNVTVLVR
jgi:CTP:molybdopterin cytidylyltransferase MocA